MKLLVLAGGFGTRLQSVVSDVPKAVAPVGNVSFLYLQLEHWIAQGVRSFVFLLHHQADLIIGFFEGRANRFAQRLRNTVAGRANANVCQIKQM